jgi:hypothetical protein
MMIIYFVNLHKKRKSEKAATMRGAVQAEEVLIDDFNRIPFSFGVTTKMIVANKVSPTKAPA